MIRSIKKNSGLSLVELIVSLMIITVVYTVMLRVIAGQKSLGVQSEFTTKAVFLGKDLMSRIISKRFDENYKPPWSSTASFGESGDGDSYFDDIDDFKGYNNSSIPGFPGFTEVARVYYVLPSDLNDRSESITEFKKIVTIITHEGMEEVRLQTVMSSHY